MILIIAEKPSVSKTISSVVGATKRNDGYYEGNGYFVTNVYGHMYQLFDVSDYDPNITSWNLNDYPYSPSEFKYKEPEDASLKKQLGIIKKLLKTSTLVINALDADREGSLIFYEIRKMLNINIPIKRLWVNTQTEEGIKRELENLYDDDGLLEASGVLRQEIDWFMGINLTTLYTLKLNSKIPVKIGRVVLPTLYLIYLRNKEIANFVTSSAYSLFADVLGSNNSELKFQYHDNDLLQFDTAAELKSIGDLVKNKDATISSVEKNLINQSPDKLFSLSDLQGYVSSSYQNFTASKVLTIAQSLYEKGFTTYPRTESRYLQTAMEDDVKEILNKLKSNYNLGADPEIINFHNNKSVFNDELVESHYALIPTGVFGTMTSDEKIVYDAIVQRFLSLFMPKAIFEEYEIGLTVDGYNFRLKGKNLIDKGYLVIHSNNHKESIDLDQFIQGNTLKIFDYEVREIKKKPPKHYTEATLLKAMQSCGKNIDDDLAVLKGYTIGTSSTRADTIEKLKQNGFISVKGRSLVMTDFGNVVVDHFPSPIFFNSDFTGKIEKKLKDIEKGLSNAEQTKNEIFKFTMNQFDIILNASVPALINDVETLGKCPLCGGNIIENKKAFSCSNSKSGECILTLWKEDKFLDSWGISLTKARVINLIEKGSFSVKSKKTSQTLKVSVVMNEELNKLNYKISK